LDFYEASGDVLALRWALQLQGQLDERFWDAGAGGYFQTDGSDPSITLRMKVQGCPVVLCCSSDLREHPRYCFNPMWPMYVQSLATS
jgi:hypothetical protein